MAGVSSSDPIFLFFNILSLLIIIGLVISVHEAAHAYVANLRGDPTARLMGRMTLNPIAHVDPLGTIVVPLLLLVFGGFIFGWAKPTPVNPLNFHSPRRDSAVVAFAGPVSNFLLAIAFAGFFRIFQYSLLANVVQLNLMLGIFNLIPVPPLDGSKVLMGFLPRGAAASFAALEAQGPVFLMVFLLFFIFFFSQPLGTAISFLTSLLIGAS